MKISKELVKGSTVILILNLLGNKSYYGYEMIKEIDKRSKGVFSFKEGTIYPILHTLEADGMVESYWDESEGGRKRKYYKITDKGSGYLKEKNREWEIFSGAVNDVLKEELSWS